MSAFKTAVVWFRNDLRVSDHQPLDMAFANASQVKAVFIYDKNQKEWGNAQLGWLRKSLLTLRSSLRQVGVDLTVLTGDSQQQLVSFCDEHQASHVYWHRRYDPELQQCDKAIKAECSQKNIQCESYPGYLCLEPWLLLNKSQLPFKVFTPFWKALRANIDINTFYLDKSPRVASLSNTLLSDAFELPMEDTWLNSYEAMWSPGELGAHQKLAVFIQNAVHDYANGRDRPDKSATSELSPHLRFGEISPQRVWMALQQNTIIESQGAFVFLSELAWRDFGYYILHHFPYIRTQAFKKQFDDMPWRHDDAQLDAWYNGQTGYPLVDAGMRQLQKTGWMHNRVRMLVASFLTKHLLMDWRLGQAWFKTHLLDHDPASNLAGWQWSAGCGVDAQPYFRIFNPTTQAEKFDPRGDYIGAYVPELKEVPLALKMKPWEHKDMLATVPHSYPDPIVDHKFARHRALEALQSIKDRHQD